MTVRNVVPTNASVNEIVHINAPEDILEVFSIVGPPDYIGCIKTINGIVYPGDIVFLYNRYVTYKGINNFTPGAVSTYECPDVAGTCMPPTNLNVILDITAPSASVSWLGTATSYIYHLYKLETTGTTLVATGTVAGTYVFFDSSVLDKDTIYYVTVVQVCSEEPIVTSEPVTSTFSIPAEPSDIIVVDPSSTLITFHTYNVPTAHHTPGCGKSNKGNAHHYDLTVNGVLLASGVSLSSTGCAPIAITVAPYIWIHGQQVGPSVQYSVSGSLTNATVVMAIKDSLGNPATFTNALQPVPMYDSALNPVAGTLSGTNNATVTWTGVNISPSFLTYVHLYFWGDN